MPDKTFHIPAYRLRPVAVGYGAALATDRILVDGEKVGYCYREEPCSDVDSGWRFFAGDESQAYLDDPANTAFYDINTIANVDPRITAVLGSVVGSRFECSESNEFVPVQDSEG
ncbi:DUF2185 domain-containing protein [Dokdonella sp. MW10]|uniref:DUF2185 domain-containing protein n=1 Tax=Dokdonella sp. MW10 TaxID=2992926 RepID=UPI003F7D95C8